MFMFTGSPVRSHDLSFNLNDSHSTFENSIFEPNEELVKFLYCYVINRQPNSDTITISDLLNTLPSNLTVVDISCGIGAQ